MNTEEQGDTLNFNPDEKISKHILKWDKHCMSMISFN